MANKNWLGMLVMILTFGLVLAGCPNGDDGGGNGGTTAGNRLVGKWKAQSDTSDPPRVVFEFLSSGMVAWDGAVVSYSLSGTTLQLGVISGIAAFSEDGNTLYLSNFGSGTNGTYTRITSGNNGSDAEDKFLKITGLPASFLPGVDAGIDVGIFNNSGDYVAVGYANGADIRNGEIAMPLVVEQDEAAWQGTGDYIVFFQAWKWELPAYTRTITYYCYLNGTSLSSITGSATFPKVSFNSVLTTVQFSKFTEVSAEQVAQIEQMIKGKY